MGTESDMGQSVRNRQNISGMMGSIASREVSVSDLPQSEVNENF